MRLKLNFSLENEKIPIGFRRCIMSFIKLSLSNYSYSDYEKLYHEKDPILKPYTFSIFFKFPEFREDTIILKDKKFEINISVSDYEIGIILYNSFNHQKFKKFSINNNSWVLENITMLREKEITQDKIMIKMMSPLVVRSREDKKDYYYSHKDEKFLEILKINIREQLKITDLREKIEETFQIIPVKPKKTVVKHYEKQIECSLGIFEISGDRDLLEFLYKAGMGSKRSSGFGMFQVI